MARGADPEAVARYLSHNAKAHRMGDEPCPLADGAAVRRRCDAYFRLCAEDGCVPSVPDLALALGTTAGEMRRSGTRELWRAQQRIEALLADLALVGETSTVPTIFDQKNWFGYADSPASQPPTQAALDRSEIGRRYGLDGADEPGDGKGQAR